MPIKGIARRWFVNGFVVVALALLISTMLLSFLVNAYTYDGIRQTLRSRSDELVNIFSSYGDRSPSEFNAIARSYIETFSGKDRMEVLSISRTGKILVTSTGFEPDQNLNMPDYSAALAAENGYGYWVGQQQTSGEKVMAITRVFRNSNNQVIGAIRYMVSLEKAEHQVVTITIFLVVAALFIMALVGFSGFYFIYTIVSPVRQINIMANKIAHGEFDVRIQKKSNDEIGQLCESINEMASELGTADRMKNDFISSISHELRTPLTAIKGWAETLQGGEVDKEMFGRGMGVIIHESERLSGIVEELLDFSRLQSGRIMMRPQRTDILAELADAVYMFTERAKAEHKFLLYDEPENVAPVMADVNRMRQVFVNIIDNALKYTPQGGTVRVTAALDESKVHVVISDSGCGISPQDLPRVKQKFYKGNMEIRGSGIGLALADEIVKTHNGTLEIESQLGVGTAVTISLPLVTLEEPQTQQDGEEK